MAYIEDLPSCCGVSVVCDVDSPEDENEDEYIYDDCLCRDTMWQTDGGCIPCREAGDRVRRHCKKCLVVLKKKGYDNREKYYPHPGPQLTMATVGGTKLQQRARKQLLKEGWVEVLTFPGNHGKYRMSLMVWGKGIKVVGRKGKKCRSR